MPPEPAPVAPGSVLWIVLDTVRADHLEPYGAPVGQTPTLARLAAEGTVFTGVASPSPWTVPSHASMLTGLPPRSHGSWYGHRPYLEDAFETLPERYRAAGFETAAFYTNGWLRVANLLQGFDVAEDTVRRPLNKLTAVRALTYLGLGPEPWIDKGAHHTVAAVSRWLAARDADRPFLLFLNLFEAHSPYLPPARYRKLPEGIGPLDAIRAHRGSTRSAGTPKGAAAGPACAPSARSTGPASTTRTPCWASSWTRWPPAWRWTTWSSWSPPTTARTWASEGPGGISSRSTRR